MLLLVGKTNLHLNLFVRDNSGQILKKNKARIYFQIQSEPEPDKFVIIQPDWISLGSQQTYL